MQLRAPGVLFRSHQPQDPPSYTSLRTQHGQQPVQPHRLSPPQQQPRQPPSERESRLPPAASSSSSSSRRPPPHWPRPDQDVSRAVSLRLKRAGGTAEVLRVIEHHSPRFNEINTALAVAQLARQLRFDSDESRVAALAHPSFSQLLALAAQQADGMNPRQVAMILTSLAWINPGDSSSSSSSNAEAISSDGSSNDGSSLQRLLLRLAVRLQQLLDVAEPEDICHCLWSLTRLQAPCQGLLLAAAQHSLSRGWLRLLTAKPLSSLLWVLAQHEGLQQQQRWDQQQKEQWQQLLPVLLAAVVVELQQPGFLGTWTPQELSMLLWSCAVFQLPVQGQHHEQQQPGQRQQQEQQGQQEDGVQHQAPALPQALLQEVCSLAAQQVVRFTPQGVANTCWAVSKLLAGCGSSAWQQRLAPAVRRAVLQLFATFGSAAAAQLQYYKPQEVANLLGAFGRLGLQQQALAAAVSHYVTTHTHLLGPRDVSELVVGFSQLSSDHTLGSSSASSSSSSSGGPSAATEPAVVHALAHRAQHTAGDFAPYQAVAAALGLVRLAEQGSGSSSGSRDVAADVLQVDCLTTAQQLLDTVARQLAVGNSGSWAGIVPQQSAAPFLGMMAAAAAGCRYSSSSGSSSQMAAAVQDQHRMRQQLLVRLLQQLADTAGSPSTSWEEVVQLQRAAAGLLPVLQQLRQHTGVAVQLQRLYQAVEVRLEQAVQQGGLGQQQRQQQPEQLVSLSWSLLKLERACCNHRPAPVNGSSSSSSIPGSSSPGMAEASRPAATTPAESFLLFSLGRLQQQQFSSLSAASIITLCCCAATARVQPGAAAMQALLAAVQQQLSSMTPGQQAQLLQALAQLQQQQCQQQCEQQLLQLLQQLADRLLIALQWQLQHGFSPSSHPVRQQHQRPGRAAMQGQQQRRQQEHGPGLQDLQLLAVVKACCTVPQLQQAELLVAAAELWQLRLSSQAGTSLETALVMLWNLGRLQQPRHRSIALQLPDMLQQVLPALHQHLLQQQLHQQQRQQAAAGLQASSAPASPDVAVLALRVFARLRYQPPPALMALLCSSVTARQQPALPLARAVLAAAATVQLGQPQLQLVAAAEARAWRQQAATATGAQQQQQQQQQQPTLPGAASLQLLWASLVTAYSTGASSHHSRATCASKPAVLALARAAAAATDQQLQQQTGLLRLAMQCRLLLSTQRFRGLRQELRVRGVVLPGTSPTVLVSRLAALSAVMLATSSSSSSSSSSHGGPDIRDVASGVTGHRRNRQQVVQQLLGCSTQQQQQALLLEKLAACDSTSGQEQSCQQQGLFLQLLPLWLQQQQQLLGLLALQDALAAAGAAAACLKVQHWASGDATLLLRQQQPGGASGSTSRILAVLLEPAAARAVNTGRPLGPGLWLRCVLHDRGCAVVSLPLEDWLLLSSAGPGGRGSEAAAAVAARKHECVQQLVQQLMREE